MSFFQINVVSLTVTIRPGIVVMGLIVSMGIRSQSQLVLILIALSGTVTWTATPEAQFIIGVVSRSLGWCSPKRLPRRWRRQARSGIGLSWYTCSWMIHAESISDASALMGPKMSQRHGCV